MPVRYTRVGWQDAPSTDTPIDAANLNHMDNGILALSQEVDTELDSLREDFTSFEEETSTRVITLQNSLPTMIGEQIDTKFGDSIGDEITSWLNSHVDPAGSAVVVDDSLSVEGAAADAKKTGTLIRKNAWTGVCSTGITTQDKVINLDDATGFIDGVYGTNILVNFLAPNKNASPRLKVGSGIAYPIAYPISESPYYQIMDAEHSAWGLGVKRFMFMEDCWLLMNPDFVHTNSELDEVKDGLNTEKSRAISEEARIEALFTAPTQEAVDNWLDTHPEATTTVQDGSLTETKFSNALKLKTVKDYVTPQMYGAKGDGVTDDAAAINLALSENDVVVFPKANYKISTPILINGDFKRVYQFGTINYAGSGSAVKITGCSNCEFRFDAIVAGSGNCIELLTNGLYERNQYIELHFNYLASGDKCIYLNREGNGSPEQYGWINEIHIYGGRFYSGEYGIWADGKGSGSCINNIKIYNAGVEGVTTGFYLANGAQRWSFVNCRYAELFDYILETVGAVYAIQFIASNFVRKSWLKLSSDTYGMILAPLASDDGINYLGNFAYIQLGEFIPITMNPETGSITNVASGATIAITNYTKVGNVCNLSLALNVTEAISYSTALMTLSFKPATRQEVMIFNNDGTFIAGYITTDGVVRLQKNLPVKNSYFIQITYLTKLY